MPETPDQDRTEKVTHTHQELNAQVDQFLDAWQRALADIWLRDLSSPETSTAADQQDINRSEDER